MPDVNRPESTAALAVACIWVHLSKKVWKSVNMNISSLVPVDIKQLAHVFIHAFIQSSRMSVLLLLYFLFYPLIFLFGFTS